jgi:phosphoribosylformylglycinamidine synthase
LIEQVGFKDLGAGGIACASVEIAEGQGLGAHIQLDDVQTAMDGLKPEVILCAETQERFMWCVPPALTPRILAHYNKVYDLPNVSKYACARVVGHTRSDGQYTVTYQNQMLVDAPAESITQGLKVDRASEAPKQATPQADLPLKQTTYNDDLQQLIAHVNIASKKPIYQHYDKQVQGRVVVERGVTSAGVVAPFNDNSTPEELSKIGITLAVAQNPSIGLRDAYACGVHAVVEACYKVIATGAVPLAITDCLCFGNPEKPEQMHALIQGIEAIKDTCEQFCFTQNGAAPLPVVAGNVSLYNESDNQAIPASPMISCVGKIDDIDEIYASTCDQAGQILFVVGQLADSLDDSVYQSIKDLAHTGKADLDSQQAFACAQAVLDKPVKTFIQSMQVIAEGGLAVALLKMLFEQNIGATIALDDALHPAVAMFGESPAFLVAVHAKDASAFEQVFKAQSLPCLQVGETTSVAMLSINDWIEVDISKLYQTWQSSLGEQL